MPPWYVKPGSCNTSEPIRSRKIVGLRMLAADVEADRLLVLSHTRVQPTLRGNVMGGGGGVLTRQHSSRVHSQFSR